MELADKAFERFILRVLAGQGVYLVYQTFLLQMHIELQRRTYFFLHVSWPKVPAFMLRLGRIGVQTQAVAGSVTFCCFDLKVSLLGLCHRLECLFLDKLRDPGLKRLHHFVVSALLFDGLLGTRGVWQFLFYREPVH
jgi:hypothetical protein